MAGFCCAEKEMSDLDQILSFKKFYVNDFFLKFMNITKLLILKQENENSI